MHDTQKFELGRVVATPGALEAIAASNQQPGEFVARHAAGDWGDVDAGDGRLNDLALLDGSRLFSIYHTARGEKLYIITEATDDAGHRAATTILLADEY
jgi:hypothetical protein